MMHGSRQICLSIIITKLIWKAPELNIESQSFSGESKNDVFSGLSTTAQISSQTSNLETMCIWNISTYIRVWFPWLLTCPVLRYGDLWCRYRWPNHKKPQWTSASAPILQDLASSKNMQKKQVTKDFESCFCKQETHPSSPPHMLQVIHASFSYTWLDKVSPFPALEIDFSS